MAIGIAAIATVPATARAAGEGEVTARYRVAYGALPVGHLDAAIALGAGGDYAIEATFGTGGLVRLIRQTEGRVGATGALAGAPVPGAFDLAYSYGDRDRARSIRFDGGAVGAVEIVPPPRADDERTEPTAAELAGAIDPASALIVPAAPDEDPCRRTLRVFDGRTLVELALAPSRTKPYRADGWSGEVTVCDIAAKPIAGARRSTREEIEAVRGAEVALAPVPGRDAWIAVELRVPSSAGMVSARAVKLRFAGD